MPTLIGLSPVSAVSREELNLLYDATDHWRDRICHRYQLSQQQRRDALVSHSEIVRGEKHDRMDEIMRGGR